MKVKLKFDLNSMREFFIRHVEKFVFGAVIVVLVYFAWSSVGREPFDLTPEQLIKTAGEAQDMIERTQSDCLLPGANRNPPKPMRQATLYSEVAKKIRQDILEDKYLLKTDLDRPPIDLPHLRPPLTAPTVEGVRGSGGHGAVRSLATAVGNAFAENRGMTGTRWVVLTGLIPLQKQPTRPDAYRETLPPFDPVRDIPQIVWFQVERAEVGAKADLDHLEWSPVSVKKASTFTIGSKGPTGKSCPRTTCTTPSTFPSSSPCHRRGTTIFGATRWSICRKFPRLPTVRKTRL